MNIVSFSTPLHCAVFSKNEPVLKILLDCGKVKFELKNSDGHTPLWLALQQVWYSIHLGVIVLHQMYCSFCFLCFIHIVDYKILTLLKTTTLLNKICCSIDK